MKAVVCVLSFIIGVVIYGVGMALPASYLGLGAVVIGGAIAITAVVVFADKTIG